MVMKLTNDTKEVCFYVECVADEEESKLMNIHFEPSGCTC